MSVNPAPEPAPAHSPAPAHARKRNGIGLRTRVASLLLLPLILLLAPPVLANGGTVRISRAPVGPYLVTVYSSPTPLRTGEVDISVLVQDSADAVLAPPIVVEALPLALTDGATADPIRREATRAQATNKLFQAAKFDVTDAGEWEFRVEVADAGSLSFRATVVRTTLLDRPYLLGLLILLPLLVIGWLALGRDEG